MHYKQQIYEALTQREECGPTVGQQEIFKKGK